MTSKRTVLIVDDHTLFREGLKSIIGRDNRFEVTGEAGSAQEALQMAGNLRPDVMLGDISLPDQSGIQLTGEIRRLLPETCVMIVTMHSKIDYIVEAFQAGARGYVVKESAPQRLLQGLEAVLKGEYFMDNSVCQRVVKRLTELPARNANISDAAYGTLSPREQEVMRLMAEDYSNREIAEKLYISPKTVENHRTNIMNKLGLHSTIELVRYAAKIGMIDVDLWK